MTERRTRVLAVASTGGHWIQLKRMCPAFVGMEMHFLTTNAEHAAEVDGPLYAVDDANGQTRLRLVWMFLHVLWLIIRVRPHIVVSTGAAPGAAAILLGKMAGARTIWVDSIANAEELSMSGRWVRYWTDLWITQWPELARPEGPYFYGSVL
ncbi:N/A [soil metagenome]